MSWADYGFPDALTFQNTRPLRALENALRERRLATGAYPFASFWPVFAPLTPEVLVSGMVAFDAALRLVTASFIDQGAMPSVLDPTKWFYVQPNGAVAYAPSTENWPRYTDDRIASQLGEYWIDPTAASKFSWMFLTDWMRQRYQILNMMTYTYVNSATRDRMINKESAPWSFDAWADARSDFTERTLLFDTASLSNTVWWMGGNYYAGLYYYAGAYYFGTIDEIDKTAPFMPASIQWGTSIAGMYSVVARTGTAITSAAGWFNPMPDLAITSPASAGALVSEAEEDRPSSGMTKTLGGYLRTSTVFTEELPAVENSTVLSNPYIWTLPRWQLAATAPTDGTPVSFQMADPFVFVSLEAGLEYLD